MSQFPVPQPAPEVWSRFSVDPRQSGFARASDADRDLAVRVLTTAFAEGRLNRQEHAERVERAVAARQLGEFVPLLSDLPATLAVPALPRQRASLLSSAAIRAWVGMAALFNVIWLFTWLGHGVPTSTYYWPMWPMLGTAIPILILWISSGRVPGRDAPSAGSRGRSRRDRQALRQASRRDALPPGPAATQWPRDPRTEGELR